VVIRSLRQLFGKLWSPSEVVWRPGLAFATQRVAVGPCCNLVFGASGATVLAAQKAAEQGIATIA